MPRRRSTPPEPARDDFIYSGQLHDSVPRALLLDCRLSPLERNAWQVIRLMLTGTGSTALPTYERLRPFLTTSPCARQASCETVARTLTVLRLTRWLSLARQRRPGHNGQWQGNLYVLHETPLSPGDALHLDTHYLELLSQSLTHASKAVQWVAYDALQALAEAPQLAQHAHPERLVRLSEWLSQPDQSPPPLLGPTPGEPTSESEVGRASDSEIPAPASDSETGRQAAILNSLRIPKSGACTVKARSKSFSTCTPSLVLPPGFSQLHAEAQSAAQAMLQRVEHNLRQAVLDEWQIRCDAGGIQQPAAYLFGILQKALRGDFHPWAKPRRTTPAARAPTPTSPEQEQQRVEYAQQHLAQLRQLLGIRRG